MKFQKFLPWFIIGIAFLFPFVDQNAYHIDVMVTAGLFVLLALGLQVIVGYAGVLNLGYAAFFAFGAYTYAIINLHFHVPFWGGVIISALATAGFGMVLAFPALRLSGDYLAIVTLGAGEITRIVLNNCDQVTGGPNGLLGVDHPQLPLIKYDFGVRSHPYYFLILIFVIFVIFFLRRLEVSRLGRAWRALREDELAASAMGINLAWAKLTAFGIGGFIAGIAGCVFAAKQGTISPDSFDFTVSVMVLAMVVLGGIGSIPGAVMGALVLTVLPECLREFSSYRMLLFGTAMILMMLFRPQGLVSLVPFFSASPPQIKRGKL